MTTSAPPTTMATRLAEVNEAASKVKKSATSPWASLAAVVIAVLWTLPTFGLLITSIRPQADIQNSGWWTFFTNPAFTLDNYKTAFSTDLGNHFARALGNSVELSYAASSMLAVAMAKVFGTAMTGRSAIWNPLRAGGAASTGRNGAHGARQGAPSEWSQARYAPAQYRSLSIL